MLTKINNPNNLVLRIIFSTAKSRRQTTPNIIKNPRLTPRGILSKTNSKSYAHNIP